MKIMVDSDEKIYPPVLTKRDMVRRYGRGEFGNRAPTWMTLAEFQSSKYRGLVHIRNRVAGGPTWYNIPESEVTAEWIKLVESGISADSLYLSGMAPHHLGTIQGEVMRSTDYLTLRYNTQKLPMREGFSVENLQATGSVALILLRYYMNDPSYEWLNVLLDRYPEHVVEFSCFSCCWGTVPRHNGVIWEVRNY